MHHFTFSSQPNFAPLDSIGSDYGVGDEMNGARVRLDSEESTRTVEDEEVLVDEEEEYDKKEEEDKDLEREEKEGETKKERLSGSSVDDTSNLISN